MFVDWGEKVRAGEGRGVKGRGGSGGEGSRMEGREGRGGEVAEGSRREGGTKLNRSDGGEEGW